MKKIVFTGVLGILCLGISACGSEKKETPLAEIESGLELLESREYFTYEYTIDTKEETASGKIKYLVEQNQLAGAWTCSMYVDENLVSEYRCENDVIYRNVEGEWIADENGIELPSVSDIIPEADQIAEITHSEENDVVEIELCLNEDALQQKAAEIRQAGEVAIETLEEMNASAEAVEAQRVQNEKNNKISFTGDTRYYMFDENGALAAYRQILEYTRNGGEAQTEISFIAN